MLLKLFFFSDFEQTALAQLNTKLKKFEEKNNFLEKELNNLKQQQQVGKPQV